ncbi:cob(I)yrinic acid a,c-diamide adenosyltransferase [Candidatus Peregrinibacteria bacterium]|nr:cob(I)yrinic acid a,c-diamide adenosyltransferase [Candidatus Peregrinibacteria bacterium]
MKITTKTGDGGETGLFGGRRVRKDADFICLVGELDELQAVVGWCGVEARGDLRKILDRIVDDIYRMMSVVGFEFKCPGNIQPIDESDVKFLEGEIEARQEVVENLNKFIRPGTTEMVARLHIARTVCRRVERGLVEVMGNGELKIAAENIFKYLNRLSDLLFILAYERETAG